MPLYTGADVHSYLDQYCIDATVLPAAWIEARRDSFIVPFLERVTKLSLSGEKTVEEVHSGTGSAILILNRRPITELVALAVKNSTINASSVELVKEEGILRSGSKHVEGIYYDTLFPKGLYNITVTYKYGYANNDVPAVIKEAAIMLATEQSLGLIASRTGGGSPSATGFNRSFGNRGRYTELRNDLNRQAMALLNPYMLGVVGQ